MFNKWKRNRAIRRTEKALTAEARTIEARNALNRSVDQQGWQPTPHPATSTGVDPLLIGALIVTQDGVYEDAPTDTNCDTGQDFSESTNSYDSGSSYSDSGSSYDSGSSDSGGGFDGGGCDAGGF